MALNQTLKRKEEKRALYLNIFAWSLFIIIMIAGYVYLGHLTGSLHDKCIGHIC